MVALIVFFVGCLCGFAGCLVYLAFSFWKDDAQAERWNVGNHGR